MNQDIFVEQIIQRRRSGTDYLIYVGLSLAFLVICFLGLFVIPMFGFLVIIAAGYGMYWVVTSRNLEFEYSVTNGDLTIDRIDVDGDYEPSNCRWATWLVQQQNRTNVHDIDGLCLAEYSRLRGINYGTLLSRLHKGQCLDAPIREGRM